MHLVQKCIRLLYILLTHLSSHPRFRQRGSQVMTSNLDNVDQHQYHSSHHMATHCPLQTHSYTHTHAHTSPISNPQPHNSYPISPCSQNQPSTHISPHPKSTQNPNSPQKNLPPLLHRRRFPPIRIIPMFLTPAIIKLLLSISKILSTWPSTTTEFLIAKSVREFSAIEIICAAEEIAHATAAL